MLLNEFKRPIPLAKMQTAWLQIGVDLLRHLTERLRERHPNVILALAGGCVRDQLNANFPRDIDLCVLNPVATDVEQGIEGTDSILFDLLQDHGYDLLEHINKDMLDSYAARFPDDEDRFEIILKFESHDHDLNGDLPLDVLFYNPQYKTIADIAESHDHSINQFAAWIDEAGELQWKYFGDVEGWGFCMQIRKNVTEERRVRVGEICTELGWMYAGDL